MRQPLAAARLDDARESVTAPRNSSAICTQILVDEAATTLYAARGRLIPFNSNSPTGSIFTAFSTFVKTRGR